MGAICIGLVLLFAGIVPLAGCTPSPGRRDAQPPEPAQGSPPVAEHEASLEWRGGRSRLVAPIHEVAHFVDRYRPLRSLPILVSQTPAPHPDKGRPYFTHGHGVETGIHPKVKRAAPEDGFQLDIWWSPAFDGDRIPVTTVDLAATLTDTRFRFEDASGLVQELRVSRQNRAFGAVDLVFVLSPAGLELRDGSVDPFGPVSGSLKLPWIGGRRSELDRPGSWRVQIVGNLHFSDRDPLSFVSSWVEFHREPSSANVLPLAEVTERAARILERQIGSQGPPASFRELLGENDAGNRVVVFDRGEVDERWTMRTSLVEVSPSGELVAVWRDERNACVAEGTLVETSRGTLPVEEVAIGDRVLSYDTRLWMKVWSEVQWIRAGHAREVLVVDGKLEMTDRHPLWIDGDWREARHLRQGSEVMGIDGEPQLVTAIATKSANVDVYDLTVDYPHNYFANGLLVHNKSLLFSFEPLWNYDPNLRHP